MEDVTYLRDCQTQRNHPDSRNDKLGGHHSLVGTEGVHDGAVPGREDGGGGEHSDDLEETAGEVEERPVEADEDEGEHGDVDRED